MVPGAELCLRIARETLPGIGIGIARTEAKGLTDVSLCFFGATNESLAKSDQGMGAGKISIQCQRMFKFGDALRRALGAYLDKTQLLMVRDHGQGFGLLCFGRRQGRHGIGHKGICALNRVCKR